jgi:hypothetical protein
MRETKATTDIQQVLFEWARWTSQGGVDIGYPHSTAFYRMSKMGGWGAKSPLIDDQYAGLIDGAVARLRMRCKGHRRDYRYKALVRAYLGRQTDVAIAKKLHTDRRTVKSARHAAESWVESHIIVCDTLL